MMGKNGGIASMNPFFISFFLITFFLDVTYMHSGNIILRIVCEGGKWESVENKMWSSSQVWKTDHHIFSSLFSVYCYNQVSRQR